MAGTWQIDIFIFISLGETCENGVDNLSLHKKDDLRKSLLAYINFFEVLAHSLHDNSPVTSLCVLFSCFYKS